MINKIKITAAFAVALSFTSVSHANMIFKKSNDKSVVLTLKKNHTATITKANVGRNKIKETLIDGKVEVQGSSLVIVREEYDVCPSVSVTLYNDVELGENMLAEVTNKIEEEGTAARDCSGIEQIDGMYTRVK